MTRFVGAHRCNIVYDNGHKTQRHTIPVERTVTAHGRQTENGIHNRDQKHGRHDVTRVMSWPTYVVPVSITHRAFDLGRVFRFPLSDRAPSPFVQRESCVWGSMPSLSGPVVVNYFAPASVHKSCHPCQSSNKGAVFVLFVRVVGDCCVALFFTSVDVPCSWVYAMHEATLSFPVISRRTCATESTSRRQMLCGGFNLRVNNYIFGFSFSLLFFFFCVWWHTCWAI